MRHRDQPTVEVAQRLCCDIDTAWRCVTDIALPARVSTELVGVEWLDGADHVAVGARFKGRNRRDAMGEWETVCEIVEVEPGRRWVWNVVNAGAVVATWGFEVEPDSGGCLVRQWARMGPAPSGLTSAIAAQPDQEARIVARRLDEWRTNMRANLASIAEQTEGGRQ
ncbi:MAG: SRPBCC family protein [Mycobacterium sp.]|nr:SRPBCC family protein [Mycobacterium sp.]